MDDAQILAEKAPAFSLVNWSFSDRKWMERGRFDSPVAAFEAAKLLVGGYYRIDDTNYARGDVFYTGKDSSLYPRGPRNVK
jgi:hypothetical protein